jgi:hypothetical protein
MINQSLKYLEMYIPLILNVQLATCMYVKISKYLNVFQVKVKESSQTNYNGRRVICENYE